MWGWVWVYCNSCSWVTMAPKGTIMAVVQDGSGACLDHRIITE